MHASAQSSFCIRPQPLAKQLRFRSIDSQLSAIVAIRDRDSNQDYIQSQQFILSFRKDDAVEIETSTEFCSGFFRLQNVIKTRRKLPHLT